MSLESENFLKGSNMASEVSFDRTQGVEFNKNILGSFESRKNFFPELIVCMRGTAERPCGWLQSILSIFL